MKIVDADGNDITDQIKKFIAEHMDKPLDDIHFQDLSKFISKSMRFSDPTEEVYFEFGSKIVNMFYDHMPDKFPLDFIKISEVMIRAYLALLSSQLSNLPNSPMNKIPPRDVNHIVAQVSNVLGHELALLGIARPKRESDPD